VQKSKDYTGSAVPERKKKVRVFSACGRSRRPTGSYAAQRRWRTKRGTSHRGKKAGTSRQKTGGVLKRHQKKKKRGSQLAYALALNTIPRWKNIENGRRKRGGER